MRGSQYKLIKVVDKFANVHRSLTARTYPRGLLGRPWPIKEAKISRPSVWCESTDKIQPDIQETHNRPWHTQNYTTTHCTLPHTAIHTVSFHTLTQFSGNLFQNSLVHFGNSVCHEWHRNYIIHLLLKFSQTRASMHDSLKKKKRTVKWKKIFFLLVLKVASEVWCFNIKISYEYLIFKDSLYRYRHIEGNLNELLNL